MVSALQGYDGYYRYWYETGEKRISLGYQEWCTWSRGEEVVRDGTVLVPKGTPGRSVADPSCLY